MEEAKGTIGVEIPLGRVYDALAAANIGYWGYFSSYPKPSEPARPWSVVEIDEETERELSRVIVDRVGLARGLTLMAERSPFQFGQMLANKADRWTGDVLVQFCAFGEVRYS